LKEKKRNDEEKSGGNTTKYCEGIKGILYMYQESNQRKSTKKFKCV